MSKGLQNMCKFNCGRCKAVWFHPDTNYCPKCKPQSVEVACQTETSEDIKMAIKTEKVKAEYDRVKAYYTELLKKY